jgi:hypothetical protein
MNVIFPNIIAPLASATVPSVCTHQHHRAEATQRECSQINLLIEKGGSDIYFAPDEDAVMFLIEG